MWRRNPRETAGASDSFTARGEPRGLLTLRSVALFFAIFVVAFSILMIPWPGVRSAFGAYYRGVGNFFFSSLGEDGRCQLVPMVRPSERMDTVVELTNLRTRSTASMETGSRFIGYVPSAFVLSLVLASPVSLRRKAWATLWGLLASQVFMVFRVGLGVLRRFTMPDDLSVWLPGPAANAVIEILFDVFVVSSIGGFVMPVLIWVLVTFRRGDWERMVPGGRTPRTSMPSQSGRRASQA